jgi:nitrogen fixation protein FixH
MMAIARTGVSRGAEGPPKEVTGWMVLICLVAFFGIVAGVNAIMITAAVTTFGGVETESSYKAGLAFAREIAASRDQTARRWQVSAKLSPARDQVSTVDISVRDADGRFQTGLDAMVRLAHPTDRRADRIATVTENGAGMFHGTVSADPGQWDLVIELSRDGERVFRSKSRVTLR